MTTTPELSLLGLKEAVGVGVTEIVRAYAALLVIGRTCAGKTTFSEFASNLGVRTIEASQVVRDLGIERLPEDDPDGFAYAMRVLDTLGHDIVVKEIFRKLGTELESPFVVSGLRDLEEVLLFRALMPKVRLVHITAGERNRFERHLLRNRPGAERTLKEFNNRDVRQNAFGLLPVADDLCDIRVSNEGTLDEYKSQVEAVLGLGMDVPGVDLAARPRHGLTQHQLYRCLKILSESEQPLRCDEIEHLAANGPGAKIRHNNANKVLRSASTLAGRLDPDRGERDLARVRYQRTVAGEAFVKLFEARFQGRDL